jgi:hypothetical protein
VSRVIVPPAPIVQLQGADPQGVSNPGFGTMFAALADVTPNTKPAANAKPRSVARAAAGIAFLPSSACGLSQRRRRAVNLASVGQGGGPRPRATSVIMGMDMATVEPRIWLGLSVAALFASVVPYWYWLGNAAIVLNALLALAATALLWANIRGENRLSRERYEAEREAMDGAPSSTSGAGTSTEPSAR